MCTIFIYSIFYRGMTVLRIVNYPEVEIKNKRSFSVSNKLGELPFGLHPAHLLSTWSHYHFVYLSLGQMTI